MVASEPTEALVKELLDRPESRARRIQLLKEIVRRGEDLPDEMLDEALRRLLELLIG
jgi:hypothetical protein